eukprot:1141712-Pelagomonas_calceolata.AAC.1
MHVAHVNRKLLAVHARVPQLWIGDCPLHEAGSGLGGIARSAWCLLPTALQQSTLETPSCCRQHSNRAHWKRLAAADSAPTEHTGNA